MEHGKHDDKAQDGLAAEMAEIDRVLSLASRPNLPEGAGARLLARLEQPPEQGAEVILFRPKARPMDGFLRYAAALPLAASLALGIYLGASGSLDSLLPATLTGDVATNGYDERIDDLGGIGEADAYAEEQTT